MSLERELKFSLTDAPPSSPELHDAFRGSPFRLEDGGTATLLDRYFDDDARSLRRSGLALRRRSNGSVETATLKSRGTVRGALHEREELEAVARADAWPDAVVARLRGHLPGGMGALAPRVELDVTRTTYRVHGPDGALAVLSFDDVSARTLGSERDALFREAELEATHGTEVEVLERIVERLERVVTLAPSGVNKLERAEALLALGATW